MIPFWSMESELPKTYDPTLVDTKWGKFWDDNKFFECNPASQKPPFSIVMPPPNVTGRLHMGHALNTTLADALVRTMRMKGFDALWVPGVDHAGIATQTVVERHLLKETGKRRTDFKREEFLKHVFEWKETYQQAISEQIKLLGASCDWSHFRFSMDETASQSVLAAFKKLYDQGLIYQGDYLVNWDTITQTALADDEVEYEEKQGFLYYFNYPLEDGTASLQLATTRPETMLGDTAVAVNPSDERYKAYIGKKIQLPIQNRPIPIIADHRVDPAFGTGVVKVTPAHDPNDYLMGLEHHLPMINILTKEGLINENGGKFSGLSMAEGRQAVLKEMESLGFLVKKEPHIHRVGTSYRSKAVIEPFLSKQWFIKMDYFKPILRECVETDRVAVIPAQWKNLYYHWIDHLRDWCISRQLWWGHRIPIWHNKQDPSQKVCVVDGGTAPDPALWEQDPDVLDTWFSSALWPVSTLGWPEQTDLFKKYYPTSTLITGFDILFFWVARMIMMGEFLTHQPPFRKTFLHGLIYGKSYWRLSENGIQYVSKEDRDAYDKGAPVPKDVESRFEKMSKSKGNVLDPLEIIAEYGADAMRMALVSSPASSRQIDLDRKRLEEYKNFTNKVWNAARFVLSSLTDFNEEMFVEGLNASLMGTEEHWILGELNDTVEKVNIHIEQYQFDLAANSINTFFWDSFCAYYLEICKPVLYKKGGLPTTYREKLKTLFIVFEHSLRLLHPFAPFITEELFQRLKTNILVARELDPAADPFTKSTYEALRTKACTIAPFPQKVTWSPLKKEAKSEFATVQEALYQIRNIRGEMKIPPGLAVDILAKPIENQHILYALTKINSITFDEKLDIKLTIVLPKELIEEEKKRLEKEKLKVEADIAKTSAKLSNPSFVERAPKELVEKLKLNLTSSLENEKAIAAKIKELHSP